MKHLANIRYSIMLQIVRERELQAHGVVEIYSAPDDDDGGVDNKLFVMTFKCLRFISFIGLVVGGASSPARARVMYGNMSRWRSHHQ